MVGLVAGRVTSPAPAVVVAAPAPVHTVVMAPPVVPVIQEVAPPADPEEDDGIDIADAIANAKAATLQLAGQPHGVLGGTIHDSNGELAVGATLVATSPALQGEQVVITNEDGTYSFTGLPAGYYTLTIYFNDTTTQRDNVIVSDAIPQTADQTLVPYVARTYPIRTIDDVEPPVVDPVVDPTTTTQGITIDPDDKNIPVPGRTFEAVLGAAAGSQADTYGVSFSGGTYLENTYYVDESGTY